MVDHFLDLEYEKDLRELRREFKNVCRSDAASLRAWFATHPYLRDNDHARIAEVSLRTVGRWKRVAGIPPQPNSLPPYSSSCRKSTPSVPPNWRCGTWLAEQYPRFSIRQIARAIGRSYTATRRLLMKQNIQFPTARDAVRSRHPCCSLAWLHDHYVAQARSLGDCARLAGVSKSTMTDWLLSFRLRIRPNSEQQLINGSRLSGMPLDERMRGYSRVRPRSCHTSAK